MNRLIRILSTLVLVSSIVSCKKDKNEVVEAGSPRLSKMTQWKEPNPGKDILTKEYIYDRQQRVIEIVTTTGDSVGGEIKKTYSESFKCYYNGNETNPYKTVGFGVFYVSSLGLEAYHFYDGNGKLIQDSIPLPSNKATRIATYYYNTDKTTVKVQEKSSSSSTTSWDSLLLANHNFNEAYLSFYGVTSSTVGYKLIYDNKVNPFSKLNLASVNSINIRSGFGIIMSPGYCKNNLTEFTAGRSYGAGDFTPHEKYTINYTYDNNDLPIECRFKDVNYSYLIKYEYID